MKWHYRLATFASAAAIAAVMTVSWATLASAEEVTLKMAVTDWPPTHIMKDLFDSSYKPPSGNTVKLDVDFIPWPDYYTRLNASLTSGEKKYNMAVSDSQWLGAFIEGGYYMKINKFVDAIRGFRRSSRNCIRRSRPPIRPIPTSRTISTASRRCRMSLSTTIARTSCATTRSRRTSRRNTTRSFRARLKKSTRWIGTRSRRSDSSSSERRATCWPGSPRTTISTGSPIRPARGTTSRRCRSTASSGSMAATSG